MSDEKFDAFGYDERHQFVHVCGKCGGLWESATGRDSPPIQQCSCKGPVEKWEGWDVAEWVRLCDCCGREVLSSGSRWSVWFCNDCKAQVRALNVEVGMALIPIGRHTLMHGVALDPQAGDEGIRRFTGEVQTLSDRIRWLGKWKRQRIGSVLDVLGLEDGVPLSDYLRAVQASSEPIVEKASALDQLARHFGVEAGES